MGKARVLRYQFRVGVMAIRGRLPGASGAPRQLRARATPAEAALWLALRDRQLSGLKFRRQHALGPFVVDFCCVSCRLIIELDGAIHDRQVEQDRARTEYLEQLGYRVVRFRNEEMLRDISGIRMQLLRLATEDRLQ
jgi:very-short-patch-repair endonuclease